MFAFIWILAAIEEENAFQEQLKTLPPDERQKLIEDGVRRRAEEKAERDRKEFLEAIKPHNLWSFLGIGEK